MVLYNVPQDQYVQNVTARAYIVYDNDEIVYGSTVTTRNLAEVSQKAMSEGFTDELLNTVTTYVDNNYFSTTYIMVSTKQYLLCTSTKYGLDILTLKTEFIKDWNEKFGSSLDVLSFNQTSGDTTPFGIVAEGSSANDVSGNIYAFFNDAKYKAKWDWLLEYVMEKLYTSTDDTYKQADSVLNGTNLTGNSSWNYGRNLIATLSGLFATCTQTHYVAGYDFTNNFEVLFELPNYNDQVLADLSNATLVKKSAVTLTDKATSGYTCTYSSYPTDSTEYVTGSTIDLSALTYKVFSLSFTAAPVYTVYAANLQEFTDGIGVVSEGGKVIVTDAITLTEDVTVNKAITIEGRENITGISYVKPGTGFSRNNDIDNNYPSKIYIFKKVPTADFLALLNNSEDKVVLDKNIELDTSVEGNLSITKQNGTLDLNGYILNLNGKALQIGTGYCWDICDSAYHFDTTTATSTHRQSMGAIWSTNELTDLGGTLNIWGGLYHMNCYCFTYITDSNAHINFMNGFLDGSFYTLRVNGNGSTVKFAGGQFKDFDPSDKNIENTYANQGITPRAMGSSTGSYVAMIQPNGELHGYDTLAAAITAIGSTTGQFTIMLKDNLTETLTIPATANVVINLNGYTLGGSITVEDGGTLIVKNYIQSGSLTATVNGTYTNLLN